MQSTPYFYDEYQTAVALRAQAQAEMMASLISFMKGIVKIEVPAFGPLYSSVNYSMCMRAMDKR